MMLWFIVFAGSVTLWLIMSAAKQYQQDLQIKKNAANNKELLGITHGFIAAMGYTVTESQENGIAKYNFEKKQPMKSNPDGGGQAPAGTVKKTYYRGKNRGHKKPNSNKSK